MTLRNTKFIHAAFIQIAGTVALFMDKMDGGTYVALSAATLGIYATANVIAGRVSQ